MEMPNLERAIRARSGTIADFINDANYCEEYTDFHVGEYFVESHALLTKNVTWITLHAERDAPAWRVKLALKVTEAGDADFRPLH